MVNLLSVKNVAHPMKLDKKLNELNKLGIKGKAMARLVIMGVVYPGHHCCNLLAKKWLGKGA